MKPFGLWALLGCLGCTGSAPSYNEAHGSLGDGTPFDLHLAAAVAGDARAGSTTVKRVPRPGSLATSIDPPSARTTVWQIESPSPVPAPMGRVVKNGSNTRGSSAAGMPGPLSSTSTIARPSPSV